MPSDEETANTAERTPRLNHGQNGGSAAYAPVHADEDDDEKATITQDISFTKVALIMCTAWFGVFLGAIDSTIIATLSGPISSEFHSLHQLSWLVTAYLIANAACQPILGRLTDIFGRGPCLVISNILFAAGNLLCGLARDQYTLILGRVIAGAGGGGLICIANFLSSDLIPLRKRGLAQGLANVWYGSGAMVGGVVGGALNDYTKLGWRLAFLIQVPPALLSVIAVHILVKVPPKQSKKSYFKRIDFTGAFLTLGYLVIFLVGLSSGGNLVPWLHPLPLVSIPLSVALFIGFIHWESRVEQPIIPVRLLADPTVLACCLMSLLSVMIALTGIFYIPLYLQVLGGSATAAGLKLLSSPLGVPLGALAVGYLMKRTVGMGVWLYTHQGKDSPGWVTCVGLFLVGAGYTAVLTTTQIASVAAVPHSQLATVTSAVYMARSVGGTVGLAIASAIYQYTLNKRLWENFGARPGAADEIRRIRDNLEELHRLPQAWRDKAIASYMDAFQAVWLTMAVWALLDLICVLPMKQHKLHSTLDRR
ncbi:conserved hypothetical protein [Uncinocarpus reesii 1704]|uniref:Major facilitator superfamily (MFS) profile domain-containing protein n=1 Tax=Uncinocarpus reesii (strain UAMH 1704) TaxID=336963 RepID=C4JI84_UNCRE|nr:uncharacterized protein UREG_02830 [Uncinocarpus reesii 1704]EEP77981.1 conserved hypothetical protein [Uncinocarpus reesii 1704]